MASHRIVCVFLAAACCGCADESTLRKVGVSEIQFQRDQQHCKGEMYSQRMARGRSAPSWTIYDYCMKARGYSRENAAG
jgi:hypothetical protein